MGVFELYNDDDEKFRFRILGDHGETIACSIPYEDIAGAVAGIDEARSCAATSHIADRTARLNPDFP
jgi:uncharacterized protein YegP (UPF0339 family)